MSTEGDGEELRGVEVSLGVTLPARAPARDVGAPLEETLPAAALAARASGRVDALDNTVDAARGPGERGEEARAGAAPTRVARSAPRSRAADLLQETALANARASSASAEVPAVAEGRFKIGRYTILSELGEGGMGVVYSAFDEELDRRVAIKVVRARTGDDSIGRARMQREAQAMAQLSHPNVVQVHDVGAYAGQVFLAMEYVRGETLTAWQRRLDPREPGDRRRLLDMYIQAGRGLRAAHERGLVHRDFKPDNVLVGEDGRARVLDFGLAASRGEASVVDSARLETLELGRSGHLDAELTRTGAIMGTPAFMAPEQFLAQPTDARTDQFSFCVALYGALYGEAPFAGESFATLRDAVTQGALRDAPDSSHVPSWLRAVVVRGLARRPEQRHESMDELLVALGRDPERARRARRRTLVAFLLVALVSGLALIGGLKAWERWRHRRHEADARSRLARLIETLERDRARGASADAERRFIGFVEDPQNRETRALGQAWLHNAARGEARGDANAAVKAYAAAYTVATADEDQIAALVGLARFFREHLRLVSLVRAFAVLESRYPDALKTPEQLELKLDTLIARGDFRAAAALLEGPLRASPRAEVRPVLEALIPATATALPPMRGLMPVVLDGGARALLGTAVDSSGALVAVGVEPSLPTIALDLSMSRSPRPRAFTPWPGASSRLIDSDTHAQLNGRNVSKLLRLRGGALEEEHRWIDAAVMTSLVHDLDGDGVDEIYAGTGPFSRHLLELMPSRDGDDVSWSIGHPAASVDRRGSDVLGLVAGDLDGDGRDELVVTLGPWNAYELQVLRRDAGAEQLELVTRHKLGMVNATRLMRRGEGPPEVAARKVDAYANNVIFPEDRPFGDPPGLYLFRLRDGELEQSAFLAEPALEGDGGYAAVAAGAWVVDLDGDGRDELISNRRRWITRSAPGIPIIELLVPLRSGSLEPLEIANAVVAGAHDLDGDGADELVIVAYGRGDRPTVWTLGAGAEELTPLPVENTLEDAELPENSRLATMWRHADELAAMNLTSQAADAFATIADQAESDAAARALINAARLREELNDDAGAAAIYLRAIAGAGAAEATAAVEGAVRCYSRRGDYDGARDAVSRGLAPGVPLDADARARIAGWRAELERLGSGDAAAVYNFDAPIADWRFDQPLMIARDGATQTLRVDAISNGTIASTPARWDGGILELSVDVDVLRAEWNSGVTIGLVQEGAEDDAEPKLPIGVSVSSWGGSSAQIYALGCVVDGRDYRFEGLEVDARADARGVGRFTIRVARDSLIGERTCRITDADGGELYYHREGLGRREGASPASVESARLMIRADRGESSWTAVSLHTITLRGATRGAPAPAAESRAAIGAWMVEGDYAAALAGLEGEEPSFEVALWRAVALAELGRTREAAATLAPFVAEEEPAAEVLRAVTEQLKTRFEVFNPVALEAFGPERYVEVVTDTWWLAHRSRGKDPLPQRALKRGLADLEGRSLSARERLRYTMQRASLYAHAGRRLDAKRDREAALALLDDPTLVDDPDDPPSWRAGARALLNFELAAEAARRGDLETARALLDDVFSYKELELQFIDLIHARPEFRDVAEELLSAAPPG